MTPNEFFNQVMSKVANERNAQVEKWGVQLHPDVDPVLTDRVGGCSVERMAEEYEIPTAHRAKQLCKHAAVSTVTWGHIAVEELCETVESATIEAQALSILAADALATHTDEEIIQTIAVMVAWLESRARKRGEVTE